MYRCAYSMLVVARRSLKKKKKKTDDDAMQGRLDLIKYVAES